MRTEEALALILTELRGLRRDLAAREPLGLSPDERLVVEIAEAANATWFTSAEIVEHAVEVEGPLLEAISLVCGEPSARRVGRFLAKVENKPVAGWVIRRGASENLGLSWRAESFSPPNHT